MDISIRLASCDVDIECARGLCLQWLDWHWENYPSDWPREGNPMDPVRFEGIMRDLPELHARPQSSIFLASIDDQPVGCVMYNEQSAGVAEFNRMFVNEKRPWIWHRSPAS